MYLYCLILYPLIMKKLYFLILTLLVSSVTFGQGNETFTNFPSTTSGYVNGTFVGDDGSTWNFTQCRGDVQITDQSIMIGRNRTPQAEFSSGVISGGVGTISFNYLQAFSTNVNLTVLVNDVVYGTVTSSSQQNVVLNSGNITVNQPGDVVIKFINVNNSDGQVVIDDVVWTGFTGTATPVISLGNAVTGLDYFEGNGPSAEGTFTASGSNLTTDITLNTASPAFELSLTSGSGFSSTLTLPQSAGAVANTTVYVRLASGLSANVYDEIITATSTGAANETVNVSGTVEAATPQFSVFGTPDALNYAVGAGPSNEDSIFVEGLFLTNDITVTAPINFEVSLTSGTGFSNSVTVPQVSGTVANTEVFVRLASGLAINSYLGDITVASAPVADQTVALSGNVFGAATNALVLTGVYDGQNNSVPKGVEITALEDVADLSLFGLGSANNGGGTDGQEFTFPSVSLSAGDVIYVSSESTGFTSFFGFAPDYTTGAMSINGDDAIELFENGIVIDTFGDIDTDGTGEAWEYTDGWAYRVDNTGPDGGFVLANWTFSGITQLDGTTNDLSAVPFPISNYSLTTQEFNTTSNFNIYPNPTNSGFVNITTKANTAVTVTVYDVLGKQVLSKTLNNNTLDVTSLTTGVYILKLNQNGTSTTKRLIVE